MRMFGGVILGVVVLSVSFSAKAQIVAQYAFCFDPKNAPLLQLERANCDLHCQTVYGTTDTLGVVMPCTFDAVECSNACTDPPPAQPYECGCVVPPLGPGCGLTFPQCDGACLDVGEECRDTGGLCECVVPVACERLGSACGAGVCPPGLVCKPDCPPSDTTCTGGRGGCGCH